MLNRLWKNINNDMSKKDWLILFFIFICAILFRLFLMSKSYVLDFDQVNYLKLAASGKINGLNHVLHAYWSPFYPLIVALFSYIVRDFELAGRLLSILCAVVIIFPLFFFVKNHFNKRIAYGASILTACYTFSACFSIKAETEFIYSLVSIGGMILGWSTLKSKQYGKAILTGLLFGLAYLSRPEGIGFLIVFWVVGIVIIFSQIIAKGKFVSYLYILVLSGIGFGAVSFPYLYYLHQTTGNWTISTKGIANQLGEKYLREKEENESHPFHVLNEDNTILLQDEVYHTGDFVTMLKPGSESGSKNLVAGIVKKVFKNLYKLLTEAFTKVLPIPLIILLGLGLFVKPWSRESTLLNLYLLSYVVFFWFILIPVFHITLRYFVPLLPVSFIWIASGADNFMEWLTTTVKNSFEKLPAKLISLVVLISAILFSSILPEFGKQLKKSKLSTEEWAPAFEQKKAGIWLKENGADSPIIMAYNHAVSFYAGNYEIKESVEIPENGVDRLLKYAKHRGVQYLVLNGRYKHCHPLIEHLYEQRDIPENLKLIYYDSEKNGLQTVIYEVMD